MNNSTKQLIGLTLEEIKEQHSSVRIVSLDGKSCVGTCDFKPFRLNVHLENNIVINAYFG